MSRTPSLHTDPHQSPAGVHDVSGIENIRRASNAVHVISRLVGNSARNRDDGCEPVFLAPHVEAGLLDALELIALQIGAECERIVEESAPMPVGQN